MKKIKWLEWNAFDALCPIGHDNCDQINLTTIHVFCYICKKKYYQEDYEQK